MFLLAVFAFLLVLIIGIIYKKIYSKKVFVCPYCGMKNNGTFNCVKCNRRIDINGFKFKKIILRCPKCFELIIRDEEIDACPDCGYKYYKPERVKNIEKA
jgi:DNA-directed RNA polymerase subunit RPC12/RpoP